MTLARLIWHYGFRDGLAKWLYPVLLIEHRKTRAEGGIVFKDNYIVGEHGPEYFTPSSGGWVIPK